MGVFEYAPSASRIDLAEEPQLDVGALSVIPAELTVIFDGERRELQPRVMKVLVALAKASPSVVSRDRLVEQCWDGRIVGDDALNRCILALRHLAQELHPAPFAIDTIPRIGHRLLESDRPASSEREQPNRRLWPLLAGLLALLVVIALWRASLWQGRPDALTVTVEADGPNARSRELASDLAIKLASLATSRPASLRLLSSAERAPEGTGLVIRVSSADTPAGPAANLMLKSGLDGSILWSSELKQPSGKLADLKQQIAFLAARVLGCAAEGFHANGGRLGQQTLKLYLNGCAALADIYGGESEKVISMLKEVLKDAPRFDGAWSKLLIADTDVLLDTDTPEARIRLKDDLAAARKANPRLSEVYMAAIILVPSNAYNDKMRLANKAVELQSDNAEAYGTRAEVLQLVGRMKDSVKDARRAVQLDPLSPRARGSYIYALANAGLHDAAIEQLREAERLWPGSSQVAANRYFFNLRYGNPELAWDYLRDEPSADWMNARSYLQARADPSPAKVRRAISDAEGLYRMRPNSLQHLIQVYGQFDRNERLREVLETADRENVIELVDLTFRTPTADFWNDPRTLRIAKRVGLLDYWRSSGKWPDFCFSPGLPYDCRVEAAKYR